jgi:outer membrane murein-binding lipoprotein Lpp
MRIELLEISTGVALALLVGCASQSAEPAQSAEPVPAVAPAPAQTEDDLQILREKIRADKKLLVAANMELTESEATGFWPIYEEYQKDLQAINRRIAAQVESYADDLRSGTLTDAGAKKLIDESVSIEQAEADLKPRYAPELGKVLPARKVARYLQIENKIRAVVKYDIATGVPLVE